MRHRVLVLALCFAASWPAAALAATNGAVTGAGVRFGFSLSPDQLVFGGQVTTREVAPRVTLDPDLEIGLGDRQTVVAFNADFHYHLSLEDSDWIPYVGLGASVDFFEVDRPFPLKDASTTEVGGNAILGAYVPTRSNSKFFAEAKVGLGDIPSLKLIAGWSFPLAK